MPRTFPRAVAVAVAVAVVLAVTVTGQQPAVAATWAACGWKDDSHKLVRTFARHRADTGREVLRGGDAYLRCGSFENWSYRHILKNHKEQWEADARIVGTDWRSHADWAISLILADPWTTSYRSRNNTFCYSRSYYLVDKRTGKVVATRKSRVIIARKSKNIITAFPSNTHCPANS